MIAGHFATALVPYELTRKSDPVPVWLFLLAAQFLDVLMVIFVSLGIETMKPEDAFDVAVSEVQTNMFVSHDVLPVVGWAALFGVATWRIWRKPVIALWCVGLVAFHEVCDLIVGYPHDLVRGVGPIGLALYVNAPILSFLIEAAMAAGQYGHPRDRTAPFTEADGTVVDAPGVTPYANSKTLAERAARDFVREHAGALHYSSVNPGFVLGPVLSADIRT